MKDEIATTDNTARKGSALSASLSEDNRANERSDSKKKIESDVGDKESRSEVSVAVRDKTESQSIFKELASQFEAQMKQPADKRDFSEFKKNLTEELRKGAEEGGISRVREIIQGVGNEIKGEFGPLLDTEKTQLKHPKVAGDSAMTVTAELIANIPEKDLPKFEKMTTEELKKAGLRKIENYELVKLLDNNPITIELPARKPFEKKELTSAHKELIDKALEKHTEGLGAGQKGEVKAFLGAVFSGDPHALTRMIPNNVRGISQVSFERGCKALSEIGYRVESKGTSVRGPGPYSGWMMLQPPGCKDAVLLYKSGDTRNDTLTTQVIAVKDIKPDQKGPALDLMGHDDLTTFPGATAERDTVTKAIESLRHPRPGK